MRSESFRGTSGIIQWIAMVTRATTFWKTRTKVKRAARMYQKSAVSSYWLGLDSLFRIQGGSLKSRYLIHSKFKIIAIKK